MLGERMEKKIAEEREKDCVVNMVRRAQCQCVNENVGFYVQEITLCVCACVCVCFLPPSSASSTLQLGSSEYLVATSAWGEVSGWSH